LVGLLATILIPWEPVGHDPDLTDEMSLATGD